MGGRLEGTGSVLGPPTISRLDPVLSRFTGHDSWLLSRRAYQTVARATRNGMGHFDSTCFVATVQFWCMVKWHFFGGHQVQ